MTIQHRLRAALPVLALLFTIVATALLPTTAQALTKVRFHASAAQVSAACKSSGGIEAGGIGSGGYGCMKFNCDGKGGGCIVECTSTGDCKGVSPRRNPASTLTGFLRGLKKGMGYQVPQSIVDGVDTNAGSAVAPGAPSAPTPPIFN